VSAYLIAKSVHVACVVLSLAGFVARGMLMLSGSPLLQARALRLWPHVVDTLLLASAVWLAVLLDQYPFASAWITAKVSGLLAYIALGTYALRRGPTLRQRAAAFVAALIAAAYIVAVALTRDPHGPLIWLV